MFIQYRQLEQDQIRMMRRIDRSETIEKIYHHRDGKLVLEEEEFKVSNEWWQREEVELVLKPRVEAIAEGGGYVIGAFDNRKIAGIAALDHRIFGDNRLNIDILFVSRQYRGKGIGLHLMEMLKEEAINRGAKQLYVSATPSEHTVNFYTKFGFKVTKKVEPELFEKEPEDIHMELKL